MSCTLPAIVYHAMSMAPFLGMLTHAATSCHALPTSYSQPTTRPAVSAADDDDAGIASRTKPFLCQAARASTAGRTDSGACIVALVVK